MKKSEFEAGVAADCDGLTRTSVARAASAWAEKAGLRFDPEEEPLPERLAMAGRCIILPHFPGEMTTATNNQVAAALVFDWAGAHPCSHLNERILAEAVRRWNAWVDIRSLVGAAVWPPSTIKNALLAILDGKEVE